MNFTVTGQAQAATGVLLSDLPKAKLMPVPPASTYQDPPARVVASHPVPPWLDPATAKWTRERVRSLDDH
jgi:hypothetical protein